PMGGHERGIRIGNFTVEHDWIIDVTGAELEEEVPLGPISPQTEDLLERQYNNGYYRTREIEEEPLTPRKPPTWSAG
ncbi:MAG: hypothetical protein ACRDHZ_25340, partial [Ktedonobacteraceae bacterium]